MSNPTFRSGPITYDVAANVKKYRLVTVTEAGIQHANGTGAVFGAVTENGNHDTEGNRTLSFVKAPRVAVHIGPASVPLEIAGGNADGIKQGTALYAAADGQAATTGTVFIGTAARDGANGRVITTLATPTAPAAAAAGA